MYWVATLSFVGSVSSTAIKRREVPQALAYGEGVSVSADTQTSVPITDLVASTNYKVHIVAEDASSNLGLVQEVLFRTPAWNCAAHVVNPSVQLPVETMLINTGSRLAIEASLNTPVLAAGSPGGASAAASIASLRQRSTWVCTSDNLDMTDPELFATPRQDQIGLVVLPNTFQVGSLYTFRLNVWYEDFEVPPAANDVRSCFSGGIETFGTFTVRTRVPPSNGRIVATTSEDTINGRSCLPSVPCGYSTSTKWEASLSKNFSQSDVSGEELPLQYGFSYVWLTDVMSSAAGILDEVKAGKASLRALSEMGTPSSAAFVMPAPPSTSVVADAALASNAAVVVEAIDIYGGIGHAIAAVTVAKKAYRSAAEQAAGVIAEITMELSKSEGDDDGDGAQQGGGLSALAMLDAMSSELNDLTAAAIPETSSEPIVAVVSSTGASDNTDSSDTSSSSKVGSASSGTGLGTVLPTEDTDSAEVIQAKAAAKALQEKAEAEALQSRASARENLLSLVTRSRVKSTKADHADVTTVVSGTLAFPTIASPDTFTAAMRAGFKTIIADMFGVPEAKVTLVITAEVRRRRHRHQRRLAGSGVNVAYTAQDVSQAAAKRGREVMSSAMPSFLQKLKAATSGEGFASVGNITIAAAPAVKNTTIAPPPPRSPRLLEKDAEILKSITSVPGELTAKSKTLAVDLIMDSVAAMAAIANNFAVSASAAAKVAADSVVAEAVNAKTVTATARASADKIASDA